MALRERPRRAVPPHKGGRSIKGGLSAYAERIGKDESTVRTYRDAAIVYSHPDVQEWIDTSGISPEFFNKAAYQLAAIHKAPEEAWPELVPQLIEKQWTVKQTESRVKRLEASRPLR